MRRLFRLAALLSFAAFLAVSFAGIRELHGAYRLHKRLEHIAGEAGTGEMRWHCLQRVNPDLQCLLVWEGLLDLPVVQTDNNSFYLDHAFDGSAATYGTAFLDAACSRDDAGVMILGHHVFDDREAVFSPLMRLYESEPPEEITLQYEDCTYAYTFLGAAEADDEAILDLDPVRKTCDKAGIGRLSRFLRTGFLPYTGVLQETDRFLILQTCTDPQGDRKLLVFARLESIR
ncbi:MAG: class B sortase [Solobacterium sp.]|nr:class B sortase [Solobacterium sp.]